MEFLDILNEDGTQSGAQKDRKEVHEKGLWHKVVHIWIVDSKGEVLIQKRSALKTTYPNMWAMSCEGHVSAGDSADFAVLKELREELGLILNPADVNFLYGYQRKSVTNNGTYFGNHFIDVFLIRRDFDVGDLKLQEEEVAAARWIKIEELERLVASKDPGYRDYPGEYPKIFDYLKGRQNKSSRRA